MTSSENKPFFSVVIPLYNKKPHIKRSVESVLNQTFTNFELIVVDDGSTDNGLYEIKNILDSRLKIYKKENGGVSSARNLGIIKAKAEYIGFLDADDEWDKSFLEMIYRMNTIFPNRLMYATAYRNIDNVSETNHIINDNNSIFEIKDYFQLLIKLKDPIHNSSSTIVKKETLLDIGLFKENLTNFEDWNVWFKVVLIDNLIYSKEVLSNIYLNATNRSNTKIKHNPLNLIKSYNELIINIEEFILKKGLSRKDIDSVFKKGSISIMRYMIKYKQFDFNNIFKKTEMYKYISTYQKVLYLTKLNIFIYIIYRILNIVKLKK